MGTDDSEEHVVIVGAGIAGLTCAYELCQRWHQQQHQRQQQDNDTEDNEAGRRLVITVLEASDRVGGRIRLATPSLPTRTASGCPADDHPTTTTTSSESSSESSSCQCWVGNQGAEIVHCSGHVLTEYFQRLCNVDIVRSSTHVFVASHADGGPNDEPTRDLQQIGMYYLGTSCGNDKKVALVPYTDPRIVQLSNVLEDVLALSSDSDSDNDKEPASVGQAIRQGLSNNNTNNLSPLDQQLLYQLAVASFGNTAGCGTDLDSLSRNMLQHFEHHWENHEIEGDYFPPHDQGGMYAIVDALYKELLKEPTNNLQISIRLGHKVTKIQSSVSADKTTVTMNCSDCDSDCRVSSQTLDVDAVVVTVPPSVLPEIDMELSQAKLDALSYVGLERIVKVCLKFRRALWPSNLQSMVCVTDSLDETTKAHNTQAMVYAPEMWFIKVAPCRNGIVPCTCPDDADSAFRAVAFLVGDSADVFVHRLQLEQVSTGQSLTEVASSLIVRQMSQMFHVTVADLQNALEDAHYYDWADHPTIRGGYMYPKVGLTPEHLQALAAPMNNKIFFAGEATNTNACCTVQAAMETGIRAANEVYEQLLGKKCVP